MRRDHKARRFRLGNGRDAASSMTGKIRTISLWRLPGSSEMIGLDGSRPCLRQNSCLPRIGPTSLARGLPTYSTLSNACPAYHSFSNGKIVMSKSTYFRRVRTRDSRLDDFAIVDDRRISDDLPRAVEIREAITDAELDREEHMGPIAVGSWSRRHLFPSWLRACVDGTSSHASGARTPPARAKARDN